ncbi:Choline dehydrogenase [Rubidibacter lacunae KORDI 51-2]|uniref:Choline dehydrogenase n=1 Tax=Rubidibacter lacunae KORDI 51-2 TaxID=582515 RepID=U5DKE0_9CHRO|nr:GMC family oxidoreductase [Rubidibacter lacunae]ERN40160.1 Choline dehydrogenase [Rubidibacter lacunae KORDI 51-2]
MIIDDRHYDFIIVGTGAGGGTLARKLAEAGKQILILERGGAMALDEQNVASVDVFKRERYHAPEQWYDGDGEPFLPQTNYAVGGNTKIYGASLMRMRERDFTAVAHQEGMSPEWELQYADFEPYYTAAEQLYMVHGNADGDPTEPPHSEDYPYPGIEHADAVKPVVEAIAARGLHPRPIPLSLTRRDDDPTGDSEVFGIEPIRERENVTLLTSAKVTCLHTNASGREVKAVEAQVGKSSYLYTGDIVVLACGAINSAALLLKSANEKHPNGLANGSDLVGRNLMKHQMTSIVQLSTEANSGVFRRSVCMNDFYWGDSNFNYPLGHIQNTGGLLQDTIFAEAPPLLSVAAKLMPGFGLKQLAMRSIGWWVQTEVLPDPNNRVRWGDKGKLRIEFVPNNAEAHDRLVFRWIEVLQAIEKTVKGLKSAKVHPRAEAPIQVVAHQCGTCRFGSDPAHSVLDLDCRTHELDNLYVVDSSFFPSCSGVSPALTVIANALRVGEQLIARHG